MAEASVISGRVPKRGILALLFAVVTINLLDRQIINILAQDIKNDLRLTDAELGLITGTALGIFKAAISIPIAWCADRLGRVRMLAFLLAAWSAFTALCGLASGLVTLALARMAVGAGESGCVPVTTALVRDHFPERPTSTLAVMSLGNPFGTFLAFLLGGLVAQRWGWRFAFVAAALPGLLLAPMVLIQVRETRPTRRTSFGRASFFPDVRTVLRRPGMVPLLWATFASMFLVTAGNAWLPAFFIRAHGLSTASMGLYGALAIGVGGGFGSLSGTLCESLRHRISDPESKMVMGSMAVAIPALAVTIFSRTTGAAMASFWIYNIATYAWLAPTIRLIQDCVDADSRALAIAVCSSFAVLAALGVGLPLTGGISDLLSPSFGVQSIGVALLITGTAAAMVGVGSHLYLVFKVAAKARRSS